MPLIWVDLILAAVALELVAGVVLLRSMDAAKWIAPFALFLVSGGLLILALRFALADAPGVWVLAAVTLSLPAHLGVLALCRARLRPAQAAPQA